jgi:hypothetical protein
MADPRSRWEEKRPALGPAGSRAPEATPVNSETRSAALPRAPAPPRAQAIPTDVSAGRGPYDTGYAPPDFRASAPALSQSQSEQHLARLGSREARESRDPRRGRGQPDARAAASDSREPRNRDPRGRWEPEAPADGRGPRRWQARAPPARRGGGAARSVSDPALAEEAEPTVTDWKPGEP